MKKTWILTLLALALASTAHAQSAPVAAVVRSPISLTWDQEAPSLSEAQAYQYAIYIDGGSRAVLPATCSGAVAFVCTASMIALTPGDHSLRVSTADVTSFPGQVMESPQSAELSIRVFMAPSAPRNFRITSATVTPPPAP